METKIDTELVKGNALEKIACSEKPLSQNADIVYLDHDALGQKFNFKYTESLFADTNKFGKYINNREICNKIKANPEHPELSSIKHRLQNPLEHLVICKINDEVGHGLFTSEDILPDTILFIYAGEVVNNTPYVKGDDYKCFWVDDSKVSVEAKFTGGLSRFMQHLPFDVQTVRDYTLRGAQRKFPKLNKALLEIGLPDANASCFKEIKSLDYLGQDTRKNVATANVQPVKVAINGKPCVVYVAMRKICKNEQIGMSYTDSYWHPCRQQTPRYFNREGVMLPTKAECIQAKENIGKQIQTLKPQLVSPKIDLQTPYKNGNMNLLFRTTAIHPKCAPLLGDMINNRSALEIDIHAKGQTSGSALDIAKKYDNVQAIELLKPYF